MSSDADLAYRSKNPALQRRRGRHFPVRERGRTSCGLAMILIAVLAALAAALASGADQGHAAVK
jgi:hypothetical protein